MPSLAAAINRVEDALLPSSAQISMTHILVKGGYVYANNGWLMARSPVDLDLEFLAPARELKRAINDRSTFRLGNTLTVQTGRVKTTVSVHASFEDYPETHFSTEGQLITEGFLQVLMRAKDLTSKDASKVWAMGAHVNGRQITVTNGLNAVAQFTLPEPAPINILFPRWLIEFLSTSTTMPHRISAVPTANGSIPFITLNWNDGTAVRGQTLNAEMDPRTFQFLEDQGTNYWEIPADWRAAFNEVIRAVDGDVTIYPDKIQSVSPSATAEVEIETPVSGPSKWNVTLLDGALRDATHIEFRPGKPAVWYGQNVKGLLSGMS